MLIRHYSSLISQIHFGGFEKRMSGGLKNNNLLLELRWRHINLYKVQTKNIDCKVVVSTIFLSLSVYLLRGYTKFFYLDNYLKLEWEKHDQAPILIRLFHFQVLLDRVKGS